MKFKDLLCFSMVYSKNSTLPKTFYQWMAYLLAGQCSCGGSRAGLRLVHACVFLSPLFQSPLVEALPLCFVQMAQQWRT